MVPNLKSPTSSSDSWFEYQVFLSFCETDIRRGFRGVLYYYFTDARISVFSDENIEKNEDILVAIDQFQVLVPIFSKNYASSKWCLMELTKMFESIREASCRKKKIMPIFYDVSVDDVLLKTELYTAALTEHKKHFSTDIVRQWEEALQEAGKIKGYELKDQGYAEFAESFVKKVSLILKVKHTLVTDNLVPRDDQVEALMKLLEIDSPGVRFVGIYGISGIGKTTITRVVFNKLCDRFDHSCFLADVCESSNHGKGIEKLQEQLLDSAGLKLRALSDKYEGIERIRDMLPQKKLLLVLDDINKDEQMQYLAGDASWFGSGSRIIATTQDPSVFRANVQPLEAESMKPDEALRLFSMHAFDQDSPPNDYLSLSKEAVELSGKLPLALKVIGSLLRQKIKIDYWVEIIDRLTKASHGDVHEKLMISYEALEDGTKQIFLDIACFFNGHDKKYPMYMWEACDFDPEVGLEELIHLSLVKIVVERDSVTKEEREKLWMHDQLRNMGRNIAHRNRIWRKNEALEVFWALENRKMETEVIQAIYLKENDGGHIRLDPKAFEEMLWLRMLILRGCNFSCGPSYLPKELRWLDWENYPSPSLPHDFNPRNLTVLQLSKSRITKLWNEQQECSKLTVLDLSGSGLLLEVPDVSAMPNLKELRTDGCKSLVTVHESVGSLQKLESLSFFECKSLRQLPRELKLPSLQRLSLVQCKKLEKFPDILMCPKLTVLDFTWCEKVLDVPDVSGMPNLKELIADWCYSLVTVHESVGFLEKLEVLSFSWCRNLEKLHTKFRLPSLQLLSLLRCNKLEKYPDILMCQKLTELHIYWCAKVLEVPDVSGMPNLKELRAYECSSLVKVHQSVGYLEKLEVLRFEYCKSLIELPTKLVLPSLQRLTLVQCGKLEKFPYILMCPKLTMLEINCCESLLEVPDVSGMPNLKELKADSCKSLVTVHEAVGSLEKLEVLSFNECRSLKKLPMKIRLPLLKYLSLRECSKLEKFPDILERMDHLETLDLSWMPIEELAPVIECSTRLQSLRLNNTKLEALPKYIYHLPNLKELDLNGCNSLRGFMEKEEDLAEDDDDSTLTAATTSSSFSNSIFPNLVELRLSGSNITSLSSSISKCYSLKKLILVQSEHLKEILELPPRLEVLDARGCKSLETVGTDRLGSTVKIRMDLSNCQKLSGKEELGNEMLSQWLKGNGQRIISFSEVEVDLNDYHFEALIPGGDIPDRFYHGRTSIGKNPLTFRVHSIVLKELHGLSLFAAFSEEFSRVVGRLHGSYKCKWLMNINGKRKYAREDEILIESGGHVWIVYINFKKQWKEEMVDGWNHFSFEVDNFDRGLRRSNISLKNSGVAFIGRSGEDLNPSAEIDFLSPKGAMADKPDDEDIGKDDEDIGKDDEDIQDDIGQATEQMKMNLEKMKLTGRGGYVAKEKDSIGQFLVGMEHGEKEPRKELDVESEEKNSGTLALPAEVVLSFCTEKENKEIGNLLYEDLKRAGIRVIEVHEKLFRAVDNSKICIPIITKEYISSTRCQSELAHMVASRRKVVGQLVVPIFYGVEPSDLKLETNLYTDALKEPTERFPSETVGQWKDALAEIAGLPGYKFKSEDFKKKHRLLIVTVILNKLKGSCGNFLAGMEERVKELRKQLDVECKGAVFVGIHGIGGIGKTTLAKAIFDQLRSHFEGCSFLSDIQETSKHNGLKYLQDKLLRDIEGADTDCDTSTKRPDFLKKKVLIVLDNVDDREQIKKLVGISNRFVSESRVIVTTRDINVLAVEHETLHGRILEWPEETWKFEMEGMNSDEALQLFCSHAFEEAHPRDGYLSICEQVVSAIGGHPLALEIVGSFLNRKPENVWEETLKKLEKSDQDLHRTLMICYEALEIETKEVFLDIACFFSGSQKNAPMYMWDACELLPEQSIQVLIFLSLVKVMDDDRLWMHDEVRDFGRKISCGRINQGKNDIESVKRPSSSSSGMDPAEGSRFWVNMDALSILWSREENKNVCGLRLCYGDYLQNCRLPSEELGTLPNLRFLELSGFPSAVKRDLPKLRWLSMHYNLEDVKATDVYREKLVILDLSNSNIDDQWVESGNIGVSKNLKALNLTGCQRITKTPVFSDNMDLERLVLEDCVNLTEIDRSIGKLKQLMYLNLKGCNSLEELPEEVGSTNALIELVIKGNGQTFKLNQPVVGFATLSVLEIHNVKIVDDLTIGNLERLQVLTLSKCAGLEEIPGSIGSFPSLVKLDISGSEISRLPDKIGRLSSLSILDLSFTRISSLPPELTQLVNLQTLNLESCHELVELPKLPTSLVSLHVMSKKLRILPDLSDLNRLTDLRLLGPFDNFQADWIQKLSRLEKLELIIPRLTVLRFNEASQLRSLSLSWREIDALPQLPSTLSRLCLAHVKKNSKFIGLSHLKELTFLELYNCSLGGDQFRSLGDELNSLEHLSATKCHIHSINGHHWFLRLGRKAGLPLPEGLRVLSMVECELPDMVIDLSRVKNLLHLELIDCQGLTEVRGLEELESLERASICNCSSLERMGDVSNLKLLETLKIDKCEKLKKVKGLGTIKSLKRLEIYGCRLLKVRQQTSNYRRHQGASSGKFISQKVKQAKRMLQ